MEEGERLEWGTKLAWVMENSFLSLTKVNGEWFILIFIIGSNQVIFSIRYSLLSIA